MAQDFTVADVLEWARTKPAYAIYCYTDSQNCAVARFGKETGRPHLVGLFSTQIDEACPRLLRAVNFDGEFSTFGALVTRLEALVQETPAKPSLWLNPQTYIDADVGESVL